MAKADLSLSRVNELLSFDAASGEFSWKPRPAGHRSKSGYVAITIDGVEVKAHQLVWFLHHGTWPQGPIDHINGNPSDNRIENLRDATYRINAENQRRSQAKGEARLLGVHWNKNRARWQSGIKVNGVSKYLGLFDDPQEAHQVYLKAKREMHAGCTI